MDDSRSGLLDNVDGVEYGTGAMRFSDLYDAWDDQDDSLQSKAEEARSERKFLLKSLAGLVAYLVTGVVFYTYIRPLNSAAGVAPSIIDSFYFCLVTLTTVGYGDFHPSKQDPVSQLFTCVFVLVGIIFISIALTFLVSQILDKEEKLISSALDNDDSPELPGRCGMSGRDWRVCVSIATFFVLIVSGVLVFALAEDLDFIQALYLVCISVTTVGYGDETPLTDGAKCFAIVWLAFATLSMGKCISDIVDRNLEKKVLAVRHRVLHKSISKKLFNRLDADGDGQISRYDYLTYQLVVGRWNVEQSDIDQIMAKFDELDIDNSGKLSLADLGLAPVSAQVQRHVKRDQTRAFAASAGAKRS